MQKKLTTRQPLTPVVFDDDESWEVRTQDKTYKLTGLSVQNVRTSLNKLKSTHEITSKTTNKYTYITINNFNDYQETTNKLTNN